jgi:hypothetical protein
MANAKTKHTKKIADPHARTLVGKKVMYIGDFTCPVCGTKKRRGMLSLYKDAILLQRRLRIKGG